jgi:hypothetical protein
VKRRHPGLLVQIRCPVKGHDLGILYRVRDGIRLQYKPAAGPSLDITASEMKARVIDVAFMPPRPGSMHMTESALAPGPGGMRHACRCGGFGLDAQELREAAEQAVREGRVITVTARPVRGRW